MSRRRLRPTMSMNVKFLLQVYHKTDVKSTVKNIFLHFINFKAMLSVLSYLSVIFALVSLYQVT